MNSPSAPELTANGEISFLAILETVLAICVSLLVISVLNSAAPIVVATLIAPLLLLRTDASTARAFAIFDRAFAFIDPSSGQMAGWRSFTYCLVWLPLCCFVAVFARIAAGFLTLISSPRETLLAIPKNWVRIALATHHRQAPEILPGIESATELPASLEAVRYAELRSGIIARCERPLLRKFTLVAIYGCAMLYRLFLKSTSLIYFPLIWVSDVPLTAKGILTFPLERVRRWYAFAVLVVMLTPLVISFHGQNELATARDRAIFSYMLPVHKTDWWHITRIIAVAVTIGVYFYARKLAMSNAEPARERRIISGANRLRTVCAVFTLACFLLIILTL